MTQSQLAHLFYEFDPNAWELPSSGYFIKASGQFKFTVTDVELKPTASNAQHFFLAIRCRITEGELAGQCFVDRLNLYNTNADTAKIAHRKLAAYCVALGVTQKFTDPAVLVNGNVAQAQVEATETTDKHDPNKKLWNNDVRTLYFADGSDLAVGKFGGGQPQQNGGFQQASPAPVAAAPTAPAPVAPQVAAPVAPQVAVAAPAAPVAPAAPAPVQAPVAPIAPTAPAPMQAAPAAPVAPQMAAQPSFAPPAGVAAPAFAAPQ